MSECVKSRHFLRSNQIRLACHSKRRSSEDRFSRSRGFNPMSLRSLAVHLRVMLKFLITARASGAAGRGACFDLSENPRLDRRRLNALVMYPVSHLLWWLKTGLSIPLQKHSVGNFPPWFRGHCAVSLGDVAKNRTFKETSILGKRRNKLSGLSLYLFA